MVDAFYSTRSKYSTERGIARALSEKRLTEADATLIGNYTADLQVTKRISDVRVTKITSVLINWRRLLTKPFAELTDDDVYRGVAALETAASSKGKPFKQNTIHDWVRILKPFLLWMIENCRGNESLTEKRIKKIGAPPVDYQTKDAEDLLSVDEIEALLNACRTSRDRALLGTLYESGARVAEIGRLRWRDITFDQYGAKVWLTDRKTRKRRFTRLTMAAQYLAVWKNDYYGELTLDAPVFVDQYGKPMTYVGISKTIQRAVKVAGIEKHITAHLFRASRITNMIALNFQESVIKESAWGNVQSSMLRTYVKLGERDMDNEFLRRAGVDVEDEANSRRLEMTCPMCHTICGPTFDFCPKCAQPLTDTGREGVRTAKGAILENIDTLAALLEKIKRGEIQVD